MKMNALKSLDLIKKYTNCPDCGNDKIGNGQGTLNIGEDMFIRTCKCGWKIDVNEDNE